MDITQEILKNKKYKKQIDQLDEKTLILIAKDPIKALEAVQKGIKQQEPEKLNDVEYLQSIAGAMQQLAQKFLKTREIGKGK